VSDGRNLLMEYFRATNDLPEGWRWVSFKVLDHVGKNPKDWHFAQYDGAVYPHLITRGPRKGRPNYRKPVPGTQRTVILDDRAFEAWKLQWQNDTGLCCVCAGSGEVWAGWSAAEGNRTRPCDDCNTTGQVRNAA